MRIWILGVDFEWLIWKIAIDLKFSKNVCLESFSQNYCSNLHFSDKGLKWKHGHSDLNKWTKMYYRHICQLANWRRNDMHLKLILPIFDMFEVGQVFCDSVDGPIYRIFNRFCRVKERKCSAWSLLYGVCKFLTEFWRFLCVLTIMYISSGP